MMRFDGQQARLVASRHGGLKPLHVVMTVRTVIIDVVTFRATFVTEGTFGEANGNIIRR